MAGRGRALVRNGLLVGVGLLALAALLAHAWVNARAAADFRALGVPPFNCRWEWGQLWVSAVPAGPSGPIGVRPGDRIVRIAGMPLDGHSQYRYSLLWRVHGRPLRRGQRLTLTVIRQNEIREVVVPLTGISRAQAHEVTRVQAMMLPKQSAGFCLWLLGVLVLLRRRDPLTRVFFLWCVALSLYTASSAVAAPLWDSYPRGLIKLFQTGFTCGWFFAPALFGHFCCVYAAPHRRRSVMPALFYVMPLLGLAGPWLLSAGYGIAGIGERLLWWGLTGSWLSTLALGLVMLQRAGGQAAHPVRRKQIQWVFAGSLAYALVVLHAFITALAGWDVDPTTVWAWLPHVLLLVTPLSLADAILRHRLLDLDVVIRRSLVYTLLTLCMGGAFIVLQQLAGAALRTNTVVTSLPAQTFAAMVVAALFGPTERWIGRVVEALFNRPKLRRLQQLHRLGQEIQFIDDLARLAQVVVERIVEVFELQNAGLHWLDGASGEYRLIQESGPAARRAAVSFRKSDGLAVWLALDRVPLEFAALQRDDRFRRLDNGEKKRLAVLEAGLCVPLSASGQLAGFLTLGTRRDHEMYGADEKVALLALGDRVAAGMRQAEMESRLRELEREHRAGSGARRGVSVPPPRGRMAARRRHCRTRRPFA